MKLSEAMKLGKFVGGITYNDALFAALDEIRILPEEHQEKELEELVAEIKENGINLDDVMNF